MTKATFERTQLNDYLTNWWHEGGRFTSITAARKAIQKEFGIEIRAGHPTAKIVDKIIELSLVRVAREMAAKGNSLEVFDGLRDLYERQPRLGVRSSTSVRQQAYSTALPIAYLASTLAGINSTSKVYEPTAGNGALLLGAAPENCTVNELNPERAAQLRTQGFTVTEHDATDYLPEKLHDVVIMNPPFGRVKGRRFRLSGNGKATTSQIDQAIALQSLQAMKDDGRAVLILGGKPEKSLPQNGLKPITVWKPDDFFTCYNSNTMSPITSPSVAICTANRAQVGRSTKYTYL